MDSTHGDDLFGRLLAALVKRPSGAADATLAGYQPPLALLEVPGEEAALAVLDVAGVPPEEVARRAERIAGAHQGRLLLVVTGGGADYNAPLAAVPARSAALLTIYRVDAGGRLERIGGARSSAIERAGARMTATPPLAQEEVAPLIARGHKEREETRNFVAQLRARRPWVTIGLIAACVLLHLVVRQVPTIWEWGANRGIDVRAGQWWRLLSSAFLHSERFQLHLLMNMMGLWAFGGFLEPVVGWRRYLVLYGASALVASLASALFGHGPSVGASGALWGLMGGGFALLLARRTIFPARIAAQLRQRMIGLLVLNVALTFAIPNIDRFAHFGGGIAGFLLMFSGLLAPRTVGAVGDEPFWVRVAAPLTALLMASSLAAMLMHLRS